MGGLISEMVAGWGWMSQACPIATAMIRSTEMRSRLEDPSPAHHSFQFINAESRIPLTVDDCVTVGAQRYEISFGIHSFLATELRNRYYMVNMNVALRVFTIGLFEIKSASFAVKTVDSNGLDPQIFSAFVASSKVARFAAFIGRLEGEWIAFHIRHIGFCLRRLELRMA